VANDSTAVFACRLRVVAVTVKNDLRIVVRHGNPQGLDFGKLTFPHPAVNTSASDH
jgi:hypothetical protein